MDGDRLNDSTRHLSAGVYIDAAFRDRIIKEVYLDRARRVVPSYGFDLEPVIFHARRALRHEMTCDLVLVATIGAGLVAVPVPTVITLLLILVWFVLRAGYRLSRDYLRYYFKRGTVDDLTHLQQRLKVVTWARRVLAVAVLAVVAAYGLAVSRNRLPPTALDVQRLSTWLPHAAALLGVLVVAVVALATAQHLSIRSLRDGARYVRSPRGPRVAAIARQQREPITIYSRFRPFIGSGIELRTWSFVQRLIRVDRPGQAPHPKTEGGREWDTPPFRTADIVAFLEATFSALTSDGDSETRLPGLRVRHHLFVAGTKTADLPEEVSTADPVQVMGDPTGHLRHYLACQIESWDGEVVTTVYVHASIQGRMLYLEFSTWALPPTRYDFHVMDEPGGVGALAYLGRVVTRVLDLPDRMRTCVPRMSRTAASVVGAYFRGADHYDNRLRGIDIGARLSARELGAGLDPEDEGRPTPNAGITYFQNRDVRRYAKVIERRLLSGVLDFLEENGVDVSEYRQRMVSILNIGAVNYGPGTVNVENSAIGEGATVYNSQG